MKRFISCLSLIGACTHTPPLKWAPDDHQVTMIACRDMCGGKGRVQSYLNAKALCTCSPIEYEPVKSEYKNNDNTDMLYEVFGQ